MLKHDQKASKLSPFPSIQTLKRSGIVSTLKKNSTRRQTRNSWFGLSMGKRTSSGSPKGHSSLSTIHESLHLIYPNWTERKVKKTENQIVMKMSIKQFSNLLFRLAECVSANGLSEVDISKSDEKDE